MPPGRQKLEQIDALAQPLYIAAHERVVTGFCEFGSPPPLRHGTAARSRVNSSVPPVPRHFHPDILTAQSA
jgi:hypothetical protein